MAFSGYTRKTVYLSKYYKVKVFPRRSRRIVQKAQIKRDICASYHVQ